MKMALASCDNLPGWEVDDHPFHAFLKQRGHEYHILSWTADTDWSAFDVVLIRTTWDYTQNPNGFIDWAERVSTQSRLINPLPMIQWNLNKGYLQDLAERGVSIAPSYWFTEDTELNLRHILAEAPHRKWFLKPIIGACAESTLRFHKADYAEAEALIQSKLKDGGMILQPYIESVETEGEFSIIYIDGQPSHAVQKIPVTGDYRVQDDFGASDVAIDPPEGLCRLAEQVWKALPFPEKPIVARVDALNWNGNWLLNELELIEPSLFFRHGPQAARMLTEALERYTHNA